MVAQVASFEIGLRPYLLSYRLHEPYSLVYIRKVAPHDTVVMSTVNNFYYLSDYPNFLSYRDGTKYGLIAREENIADFWRRIQPEVILLDPEIMAEDDDLSMYVAEKGFRHPRPDLWVAETLSRSAGEFQ